MTQNPYSAYPEQDVAPQQPPRPGWWSRNWKWFLPTVIVLPMLGCCVCCGGTVFFGLSQIKASPPYVKTLAAVRQDPKVTAALGTPIEDGWMIQVQGNFQGAGGSGNVSFVFPVSGPKDKGAVTAQLSQTAGVWKIDSLTVDVTGSGQSIQVAP